MLPVESSICLADKRIFEETGPFYSNWEAQPTALHVHVVSFCGRQTVDEALSKVAHRDALEKDQLLFHYTLIF